MAEKITIAELNIDDEALLQSTADLKKQIDELKKSQKEITDLNKKGLGSNELRKGFAQTEADLKLLKKEYNENIKAIGQRTKAVVDATNREKLLEIALNGSAESIEEAREQTKLLTKLRNQTNVATAEGREELEQLNAKLDENTEFVRENADSYLKLKLNVGNYTESIKDAFKDLNIFNGGLLGFIGRAQKAGGVGKLLSTTFGTISKSLIGLTKSAVAFLLTPIGAFIGALVVAFLLIKNAFEQGGESANRLKDVFASFGGIIKGVLKFLKPLGDFLIDGLVAGLELAEKAVYSALEALETLARFVGLDGLADSIGEFKDEIVEAAGAAKALAQAERELAKEQRKAELIQLNFQKAAEKLRQIRDNELLSFKERIKANEDLAAILKKQAEEELRIAELALHVANLRVEAEENSKEALDEQADALVKIAEIQERITSQESEQLTNRVSLLREAADAAKERAQAAADAADLELEVLKEQNKRLATNDEERLEQDKRYAAIQRQNLLFRLEQNLISENEYNLEILKIRNQLLESQDEIDQNELDRLQAFQDRKKELLDNIRILNEEDEQARQELELEIQFEKDAADIEKLIEDETQRTELLALLTEERELVLQGIRDKFAEESLARFKAVLEKENQVQEKAGQAQIAIARSVASALIGVLGDSLGARLAGIAIDAALQIGQVQTTAAAASAANLAQATAAAPPPLNVPFIATAVGQNAVIQSNAAAQTSKIITAAALGGLNATLSKVKFAKGGIGKIEGASHAGGGVPIYAGNQYVGEAEGEEGIGILNKRAFAGFMEFNNSFNGGASGSGEFQGGGIITQAVRPDSQGASLEGFAEAIADLQIKVAVEDINDGQSSFAEIEDAANV